MERTVYLGQEVTASAFFLDKANRPLESSNPSLYPCYQVTDPVQDIVVAGVGTFNDRTLAYDAIFTMPEGAMLSTDAGHYQVSWDFIDTTGKEHSFRETFDVVHPSYDLTQAREQQKLVLPITSIELSIPLPRRVMDVELKLFNQDSTIAFTGTPVQMGLYSDYYIYSLTIPDGVFQSNKDYMAVWVMKDSGNTCVFTQVVHCASLWDMENISNLRMYLDKVAKAVDTYQGYKDSELYFYLQQGLNYINGLKIPTDWTFQSFQTMYQLKGCHYWLLEAAKWVGLRAQYLAEGDSSFDFSGQPVSLTSDRSQFIEAELGRIKDGLDNQFIAVKNQILKNIRPVGFLNLTWPSTTWRYPYLDGMQIAGVPLHRVPTLRI